MRRLLPFLPLILAETVVVIGGSQVFSRLLGDAVAYLVDYFALAQHSPLRTVGGIVCIIGAMSSYYLLDRFVKRGGLTQMVKLLSCESFPQGFAALEMLWPKRLGEEVWHPAFNDERALYLELRERSWLPMLNVFFTMKVLYLVVVTGRIAFLDWSLSRLTNKRSRLTGNAVRQRGKTE